MLETSLPVETDFKVEGTLNTGAGREAALTDWTGVESETVSEVTFSSMSKNSSWPIFSVSWRRSSAKASVIAWKRKAG